MIFASALILVLTPLAVAQASCSPGDQQCASKSANTHGAMLLQKKRETLKKTMIAIETEDNESSSEGLGLKKTKIAFETEDETEDNKSSSEGLGYTSRDEIPSGCVLSDRDKLPDGARCLFSDQCQANRCCPYLKVCNPPMTTDQVKNDPLLKAIMWSSKYGGDARCGKDTCDTCAFRSTPQEYQCTEVNGGPILEGSDLAGFMPPWDTEDRACKCDERFIESMWDGSWVPACEGQGGGASSGGSGKDGGKNDGKNGGKNGGKKPSKPSKKPRKTKKPTAEPTPAPTAPPRPSKPAGGDGTCKNSDGYVDSQYGLTCAEWVRYDCEGWSMSDDLIANCPCSCGVCDSDTYADPYFGDDCKNWHGFACTGFDFSDDLQANCPYACKVC